MPITKRGRGKPPLDPKGAIMVRILMRQDMVKALDRRAKALGLTRSAAARAIIRDALGG
jgi:hypothetical protein